MTKRQIIEKVKSIILAYSKPDRIYLYGSQANGEADSRSDIDIAYNDENNFSNAEILYPSMYFASITFNEASRRKQRSIS